MDGAVGLSPEKYKYGLFAYRSGLISIHGGHRSHQRTVRSISRSEATVCLLSLDLLDALPLETKLGWVSTMPGCGKVVYTTSSFGSLVTCCCKYAAPGRQKSEVISIG